MNTHILKHRLLAGLCLFGLAAPAHASVTARLEPQSIDLGDSARLALTFDGQNRGTPDVPSIDGLEIMPVGQQTSMQTINGAMSTSVTHLYRITPSRAGNFTIPSIQADGAGGTAPLVLSVGKGGGSRSLPAPKLGSARSDPADSRGEAAFLRVVIPKHEMTVGELVPVEIKAYFRAGVSASLNGVPTLSSDAFALNELGDHPTQSQEMIDGAPHTVVIWTSSLSAVKTGEYALNLDLPVMVRVREERRPRSLGGRDPFGGGSPFNDPFFQDFFGGVTEKPLTLHTDGAPVAIAALPSEGRPADFSGAVGEFEIAARLDEGTGAVGDPLSLTTTVTGTGNFSRVATDGLRAGNGWKSYPPGARFEPADSSHTSGRKIFEQSIVPTATEVREVPAVSFSYFDPNKYEYVTKTTVPIAVEIAEGSAPVPASAESAAAFDTESTANGMATRLVGADHAAATLRPLVRTPWFLVANAAGFGALAIVALVLAVRRRRAGDSARFHRQAAEKAIEKSLASMDAALREKDAPRFFDAARIAVQERLGAQWHLPPGSVTVPEISARLNGHGEALRDLFHTADEVAYSGRRLTSSALVQWRSLVHEQLRQLAES